MFWQSAYVTLCTASCSPSLQQCFLLSAILAHLPAWPWHQIPQSNDRTQMDVDELVTAVSRLSTVSQGAEDTPAALSFGHRRGRGVPFGPKPRGSGHGRGRGRSTNVRGNIEPPAAAAATQSSPS